MLYLWHKNDITVISRFLIMKSNITKTIFLEHSFLGILIMLGGPINPSRLSQAREQTNKKKQPNTLHTSCSKNMQNAKMKLYCQKKIKKVKIYLKLTAVVNHVFEYCTFSPFFFLRNFARTLFFYNFLIINQLGLNFYSNILNIEVN